jgi:hypothetical protein
MEDILNSFLEDLSDIEKTFTTLKLLGEIREEELSILPEVGDNDFINKSILLYHGINDGRNGLVKIPGIFVLYIGGRFENYIQTIFEELAIRFVNKFDEFERLPKKLKDAIVRDTSKVVSSPRKFGFSEGMAKQFVHNLSKNFLNDFDNINHPCLSRTEGNMRSDILSDLFTKIAIKDLWKEVGMHVAVRSNFETDDSGYAQSEAKSYLNQFMTKRNSIAHPNGATISWSSFEEVEKDIKYFKMLSRVIMEIGNMKILSISQVATE